MRLHSSIRVMAAGAVAIAVITVPGARAFASGSIETYDAYAAGGGGTTIATSTASFTLDGITYTTDGAVTTDVETVDEGAPLSSGPSDGVLTLNALDDTPMTEVTMTLANGDPMTVSSFDFDDGFSTGIIEVIPNGNSGQEVTLSGSQLSGHVDLSGNANFKAVTSMKILDSGDSGFFIPSLNNFSYNDLSSPPALTSSGGSTAFTEGNDVAQTPSTPVTVDSGMALADGDSTTATTATVSITGNFHSSEDVLAFTNTSSTTYGNIGSSYNSGTGVLTLTSSGGTATIAQWQAAFDAVTYTDSAVIPNTATRTVSFRVTSDGFTGGNTATKNVTVADTEQSPIVTTIGGTKNNEATSPATTIDGGVSVTDSDNATQASGTVSIGTGFQAGDTLAFTNTSATLFGNISASYNAGTGVLTLTSAGQTATNAKWGNALSAVTFSSSSSSYGNRTIGFVVNDGTSNSQAATDTVDLTAPPSVTTDSGSASFVAGDNTSSTPVAVDSGVTVADVSTPTLNSATVSITGNFHSPEDVLAFTNTSGITFGNMSGSYNSATGVLTLTSAGNTATLAQWQAALRAVKYTDTAVTPNASTRTISFTITDHNGVVSGTSTRNVTVGDTDQSPVITTFGGTTSYAGGASATTVDGDVTVTDLDNSTQASGTVSISGGFGAGDVLTFTNTSATLYGNISPSYNSGTGVLTLTSAGQTATNSQWENALDAITFSSSSTSYGNRIIGFVVNDGTSNSATETDTVNMTDPVIVTTDAGATSFVSGDNTSSTPVAVDSGVTVTDVSSSTLESATVSITSNFHSAEDVLVFTNASGTTFGNITGSYNSTTGVLTLTSAGNTATIAQWQAVFDAVTYTNTALTPNTSTRTISFNATDDNGNTSATVARFLTVGDTDQSPIVVTSASITDYLGGMAATTIDGGVTVTDADNTTQASSTVSISTGFHSGDTLAFTNTSATLFGNISASYNSLTGVLTLTSSGASATDAQWANALSAVTFSAGSAATPGNRTISFVANDGAQNSVAATDTVAVTVRPVVSTDSGSAAFVAGNNVSSTPVAIDSGVTVVDASTSTLNSATVSITGNFHSGQDVLAFTNTGGTTFGNITGSYNSITGVLTLTSAGNTATLAQWQTVIEATTYTDTALTPNTAIRTVTFSVTDSNVNASIAATRTVTVADTDQTPVVVATGGTTDSVSGGSSVVIDAGVTVSDLDNTRQASGTVSITSGLNSGDTLSFTNTSATLYGNINSSYNSGTGVLTLTSAGATATDAQWANTFDVVTFVTSSASTSNRTIAFATNDGTENSVAATDTVAVTVPPVVTTDSGSAAFVAGDNATSTPVAVDSGVTVTDASSSTLDSATVSITGNFHSGQDVLAFTNTSGATFGDVSSAYNATTGVLTLTSSGGATLTQWNAALTATTYTDSAVTPNTATRTVTFNVIDGNANASNAATRTITVADTDQTPIVVTTAGTRSYVVGANPVVIDGGVTVSDLDAITQAAGTATIGAGFDTGDTLAFTNTSATLFGNIGASYNAGTGVLTLTSAGATATNVQWANTLDAVTFTTTSTTTGNRTITFVVNDGTENSIGATDTVDVRLHPVHIPTPIPPSATGIVRVAGSDSISTSIAASQSEFPVGTTANAVVLVGQNDAIDGLIGAPLAAAANASLLLIDPNAVPASVIEEIHRLLGNSGTVYLLGGTAAIFGPVESQLQSDGYTTQRIGGPDRYQTAVAIADEITTLKGAPAVVFEVTGLVDADALTAATAAVHMSGVILLTAANHSATATNNWLTAHPGIVRYAVGGPAAAADPGATSVTGADRYATASDVAARFFPATSRVALANGQEWSDAAVAAECSALNGAPLLLVTSTTLPGATNAWLKINATTLTSVTAYGGTTGIGSTVLDSVATITGLPQS